jgi:hypothetical protein
VVTRVIDGDTIVVDSESGSAKVRLAEIDAPESKQAHGQVAAHYLAGLILNRQVTIQYSNPPQGCATQEGRAVARGVVRQIVLPPGQARWGAGEWRVPGCSLSDLASTGAGPVGSGTGSNVEDGYYFLKHPCQIQSSHALDLCQWRNDLVNYTRTLEKTLPPTGPAPVEDRSGELQGVPAEERSDERRTDIHTWQY